MIVKGVLGLATVVTGVVAIVYNDKLVGMGLVTAGTAIVTDVARS